MSNMEQRGFTLVEILIVIVVIAVLASISVVAYNGAQERARITVAKADLGNISRKLELYQAQYGDYPNTGGEVALADIGVSNSDRPNIAAYCSNGTGYAVIINEKENYTGRQFKVGSGQEIAEVDPKLAWSGSPICTGLGYPGWWIWNSAW